MRPEPIILQTLAAKPESRGETLHVIEAERGWINRLLNARHPLTNRARERTTPISVQERDAHIQRFAMILTHAVLLLTCRTQRELLSSQTSLPSNLNASTQCLVGQLHCKAL